VRVRLGRGPVGERLIPDEESAQVPLRIGRKVEAGQAGFDDLEKYMLEAGDAKPNSSGRQEMLENVVNRYLR